MLDAKLTVVGGDAKKADIRFNEPMLVGRGSDCTLPIRHKLVSRRHCEIFEKNGYLYVKDLDSLNGTFIDNERIEGTKLLNPNQLLTIGNITLRAIYEPGKHVNKAGQKVEHVDTEPVADHSARIDDVTVYQPVKKSQKFSSAPPLPLKHANPVASPVNSVPENNGTNARSNQASIQPDLAASSNSNVFDETINDLKSPSNTDPSIINNSDLLESETDDAGEHKSISLSALEELQQGKSSKQSISSVDLDGELLSKPNQISPSSLVDAEFFNDDVNGTSDEEADSRLGSFIRKFPR